MIRFPAGYDSLNRIKRYQDYYQASYGVMLLSAGQFSPLSLFAAGEQGAWYDPSDLDRYMSPVGSELSNQDFTTYNNYGPTPFDTFTATTNSLRLANATNKTTIASSPDAISVVSGRYYSVVYTVTVVSGGFDVSIRNNVGATSYVASATLTTSGTYSLVLAATVTENVVFQITARSGIADYTFTNISVKELTAINTATMFTDAAGTTPVTAVEQPVGLLLDKSKGLTLGAELAGTLPTPTIFDASGTVGTWDAGTRTFGNTGANVASRPRFNFDLGMVAGKTYLVSGQLSGAISKLNLVRLGSNSGTNIYTPATGALLGRVAAADQFLHFQFSLNNGETVTIDNISIRELPGNHASQSTAASRPVLSARVNLLTFSEQFDNAVWTKANGGVGLLGVVTPNAGTDPLGGTTADRLQVTLNGGTASADISRIYQSNATTGALTVSLYVRSYDGTSTYAMSMTDAAGVRAVTVTPTWQRVEFSATSSGSVFYGIGVRGAQTPTNSNAADILIWGADLRVTNVGVNLPAYQRVAAATDYDTSGFPLYLKFDGVDDSLATGTIDPGAVDKAQVFAGVRKLSDAATGMILELSSSLNGNPGTFYFLGPYSNGQTNYNFSSKGTLFAEATGAGFVAPITSVLTGTGDIIGDLVRLRSNGTQVASSVADQGTGNYLAYPLYIGRRGGSTLPFNGQVYSMIVRFSAANLSDAQIASTETYVNNLTKAY